MAKQTVKPVAAAVGAAFMASVAIAPLASAAENPFQMTELSSGYEVADGHEGKCGEGKCGGEKAEGEGKCGEGKCGEDKAEGEGKCGEGKCGEGKADEEGKCGEGKCGGEA
ncbi:MAG: HvfA family oxazolone/thioamide-modified RiPP metallophore [bacterium]